MRDVIIVIGASGAIGSPLVKALIQSRWTCVCALHRTSLPADLASDPKVIQEFGFDILDASSVNTLFSKFAERAFCVWNLAAPLSVESEKDPAYAERVVVEGMQTVLKCMKNFGIMRICFSDSIGSFGMSAPRENCKGSWLIENPEQDPGSVYGRQKRKCRNLLKQFSSYGIDTRFAVIPGVLHTSPSWGAGTTEYALSAVEAACLGKEYTCPVPLEAILPMIYIDDLINALVAFMEADVRDLLEPDRGYAISGFSFSALELFQEIQKNYYPNFQYKVLPDSFGAAKFAKIWPNSLSKLEAKRDFSFQSRIGFSGSVKKLIEGHRSRLVLRTGKL